MVGYWVYKYNVEDRDIGILDLTSLEEASDVDFPVPAICLVNPFVEKRLINAYTNIKSKDYLDYLKGISINGSVENMDYENVTINLDDYFTNMFILWT